MFKLRKRREEENDCKSEGKERISKYEFEKNEGKKRREKTAGKMIIKTKNEKGKHEVKNEE